MKRALSWSSVVIFAVSCGTSAPSPTPNSAREAPTMTSSVVLARHVRDLPYEKGTPPCRFTTLPAPVKSGGRVRLALFSLTGLAFNPSITPEQSRIIARQVSVPVMIDYFDAVTLEQEGSTGRLNQRTEAHFGIPSPAGEVAGMWDDPTWPSEEKRQNLRTRIYAALDVLLPIFADDNLPWTEEANKAAQVVRDYYPVAAEPGLWRYYEAEGREFFAWVAKRAPAAKAPMPWDL